MDARVPMDIVMDAFGVPAVVTRPAPNDTPIETAIAWVTPGLDEVPLGIEARRKQPHRVMVILRDAVPALPHRTRIEAPERLGDEPREWVVDEWDDSDPDCYRALVLPSAS